MELIGFTLFGIALAMALNWVWSRKLSFMGQRPEDYEGKGPDFNLREVLDGPIQCEGMIYGPTGRVTSRFVADMDVNWNGNVGVMDEVFTYDSGAVQKRQWTLTLGNDGSIKAEAPDVIGVGTGQRSKPHEGFCGQKVLAGRRIRRAWPRVGREAGGGGGRRGVVRAQRR